MSVLRRQRLGSKSHETGSIYVDVPTRASSVRKINVMVAGSSIAMQSHKTFPLGVQTTSARWPIAKGGCVPMPITPGSYWRYDARGRPAATGDAGHQSTHGISTPRRSVRSQAWREDD